MRIKIFLVIVIL